MTRWYEEQIKSFEGIKPPYLAPDVDEVNWFLYAVHLGTRFSHSTCRAIVEDMRTAEVEAELYSHPLYLERYYVDHGWRKGSCFVTEKVADRAIALPFHTHLTEEQIAFIVKTAKDASINVAAAQPSISDFLTNHSGVNMPVISIQPSGKTIEAGEGSRLLDALKQIGEIAQHQCDGQAQCGQCHIYIQEGRKSISKIQRAENEKLDTIIGVSSKSRLALPGHAATKH